MKYTMWALTTQDFDEEFKRNTNPAIYFTRELARNARLPYQKVMKVQVIVKKAA